MEQSIRFCTSSDGVKLAYAVTGDGPPLVMSATWLTHLEHQWRSLAWKPWLEALSRDHRLLRYDSRGCGLSDRAIDNLSFETWIKDFEKVIDAAGFGRFSLVSTCWGGPVAIEYAARIRVDKPRRISSRHPAKWSSSSRNDSRSGSETELRAMPSMVATEASGDLSTA